MTDLLSHSAKLHVLPEELTRALEKVAQPRKFADGAWIFRRGDGGSDFFKVETGRVQVLGRNVDGREFTLSYLGPGEWFGEMSMLDGLPRTHDNIAKGDCTLLAVRRRDVERLIAQRPDLGLELAKLLAARVRMLFGFIEDAVLRDFPSRLAKRLLELAADHGRRNHDSSVEIGLHLPHEELATMLGSSREAIGRHLRTWEKEGVVSLRYGRITVVDAERLAALAQLEDPLEDAGG